MLWDEIKTLPEKQRAALLLNMRDAHGDIGVDAFATLGIAQISEIGTYAGVTVEEFYELWGELPLDDDEIARRIGAATRQQVINLRKTARERLARRLQLFEREQSLPF